MGGQRRKCGSLGQSLLVKMSWSFFLIQRIMMLSVAWDDFRLSELLHPCDK
jgi:hypothetical protein